MRSVNTLLLLEYALFVLAASENGRPRGVGPECIIGFLESRLPETNAHSRKVLQGHGSLHMHLESFDQYTDSADQ